MKLQELFLKETTEEDRALISLANSIFSRIQDLSVIPLEKGKVFNLGTIGDLFDTPINILDPVKISVWTEEDIVEDFVEEEKQDRYRGEDRRHIYGLWNPGQNTIILNYEFIASNGIKSVITHELRHALDDYKSEFKVAASKRYKTPKKKEHRKDYSDDPYADNLLKTRSYRAQPSEINARFTEVLHGITNQARHASKRDPAEMRPRLMRDLKKLLDMKNISDLFPEKEKSRDYKRLIKRAVDFIDKEIAYYNSIKTPANDK